MDFLGHRLEQGMIGLHQDNVEKIKDAPRPSTKKQVRSFMGLAGYYRDFIPNFAAIAAPLSDLTRKGQPNKVEWGEAQEKAYQTIKSYLTSEPILRLPDPAKTYFLRTDASNNGIGAVLMQTHDEKLFPVCYASKKLSSAERNYSTIEKECLAIVLGIKKSHVYVYGVRCTFCAADRSRAAEVHGQRKIYQRTTHAMGDGSTKVQFQGGSLQRIRECWSGLS